MLNYVYSDIWGQRILFVSSWLSMLFRVFFGLPAKLRFFLLNWAFSDEIDVSHNSCWRVGGTSFLLGFCCGRDHELLLVLFEVKWLFLVDYLENTS